MSTSPALDEFLGGLYRSFGPPKAMGESAPAADRPHFFLHRNFLGEQDLAILFNTKRCRYQCKFCALPFKSSREWIPEEEVLAQFRYVLEEDKHALGVLERVTIANEGSVFDETTFPAAALTQITAAVRKLPRVRKIVLETRLEFLREERLREIADNSGKQLDILTGFETLDEDLRERVLGKREPLETFLRGLDTVGRAGCELTAYVLFKPDPVMTDEEAWAEAEASIDYLHEHCATRGIPLTIRLNPMYVARGTQWARRAEQVQDYLPPRLSDIIALAERKRAQGIAVYLGLTSEGLSDEDKTYRAREDFSRQLIKQGIVMNGDGSVGSRHHLLPLAEADGPALALEGK
ncbi:radical SAM protein [Streptomyces sp. NBC_00557]|uniref:radical SAM protein n=1 Tax=Streptomyces sp. NBC_00557 TaxID=2975776 RepID=UPI002E820768|nr:radical SAM protein [Streptomyces sp. NBC_00557]WUC39492.1 radical SAM protein [Streptomyces sp. NBC_00557]